MSRSRPSLPLILVTLTVAALSGCVGPTPDPTAPPSPIATASPTPVPIDAPAPRFAADCATLAPVAELQAFVGAGVAGLQAVERGRDLAPDAAAVDQLGALFCDWDDGQTWPAWQGPPEGRQAVRLHLVRDAADAAQRYVDTYAEQVGPSPYGPTAGGPRCIGVEYGQQRGYCHFDAWLSGAWIAFTVNGIALDGFASDAELVAAFTVLTDHVVTTLGAEPPQPEAWQSPTSAVTADDCADLASEDEVRAITGAANTSFGQQWDGPRIGQYFFASEQVGSLRCAIAISDTEAWLGSVSYLPGGDWAFTTLGEDWARHGGVAASVAGLDESDAVLRCDDSQEACLLDLRVDRDWVRISLMPTPPETVTYLPEGIDFEAARASAVPLAERIVANLLAAA